MKKSFWFWLSFVIAVVLAVYFSSRIVMTVMGHGANSRIKSVYISSDNGKKNLGAVAAAVGIAPNTNTFSVKLDDIKTRISNVPGVRDAAVRRLPNGNLSIRVRLHQAVAYWTDGTDIFPISGDGIIINTPIESRPESAVVFSGKVPNDIREIAKLASQMTQHLEHLEWIEDRRWNIYTRTGATILLPEGNPAAAFSALMILDKNHGILSRNISSLDMRDTSRILVK